MLLGRGLPAVAARVTGYIARSPVGGSQELPGPVGERNLYILRPRGRVVALAQDAFSTMVQVGAILATGNEVIVEAANPAARELARLPAALAARISTVPSWQGAAHIAAVLFAGDSAALREVNRQAAAIDGPIVTVQAVSNAGLAAGTEDYELELLLAEVAVSTNTAAAGGNAKLMTIG